MKSKTTKFTVIRLPKSNLYVVDAPPTGFKSTALVRQATAFGTEAEAKAFCTNRGIFGFQFVQAEPLTAFERFVWDNGDRSCAALATETNRTEGAVTAAYNRAHDKMRWMSEVSPVHIKSETNHQPLNEFQTICVKACSTREQVAEQVRKFGFDAHVGGHHVAIHDRHTGTRLGLVTSLTLSDFN
jgi:hypothetical protein